MTQRFYLQDVVDEPDYFGVEPTSMEEIVEIEAIITIRRIIVKILKKDPKWQIVRGSVDKP